MSIASELTNLESNIGDAYDAVNDMSGIIPQHKNMANLDQAIRTIPQNPGTTYTAGNGINIDANNEISIDDTVVAELSDLPGVMTGATSGTAGTSGLVPAPSAGNQDKFLKGDGTWGDVFGSETVSSGQTAWKFPDGKMICFGVVQVTAAVTGSYENSYYAEINNDSANIFAETFIAAPVVTVTIEQNSSLFTFDTHSTTTTGFRGYIWGQYSKTATVKIHYIAIGKWK